jgi:2-phosphosulfolactate phosphatase
MNVHPTPHRNSVLQPLNVHFLPALMNTANLAGGTAVIIDILRASSTIITAIHNGAKRVIPCGTPDEARQIREQSPTDAVLLGGERGGVLIEGFDCGNSPTEYAPLRVAGHTIAFTTTNGTQALLKSASAETILIGAFVNRQAVVNRLHADQRPVHLVCAGTDGEITGEDVLFAGAVVEALQHRQASDLQRWKLNDCAGIAQSFWRQSVGDNSLVGSVDNLSARIESAMRVTHGGRNLIDLGYDNDIRLCSAVDCISRVPVFSRASRDLS